MADIKNNRSMPAPVVGTEPVLDVQDHTEEVVTREHSVKKVGDSDTKLEVTEPAPGSKRIEVIATTAGYIYNSRKVEGDRFSVANMEMVGSWMLCLDAGQEKQHQAMMKAKKDKAREEAKAEK